MSFAPLRTARLVLRAAEPGDAEAAFVMRNLPEVARYQDWQLPYTLEQAQQFTTSLAAQDWPASGGGTNLMVVEAAAPERVVGDVYAGLRWDGRTGYVGFTFHPDYWGRGYATEATQAVIHYLFTEVGVSRIESSMHPDNVASARVVEACGLTFEGLTRQSFWVGDECSDDVLYGMLRADWEAWRARPRHRPERVELVPVTGENSRIVAGLTTHRSQERFVATMLGNFRDALAPPMYDGALLVPWYRAIVADGEIVGFLMTAEPTATNPNPYLWRLLVDRRHQRRGIASAALDVFEQRCREQGAAKAEVSWVPGPGSPEPMYLARGYEPTGLLDDGEINAIKQLAAPPASVQTGVAGHT